MLKLYSCEYGGMTEATCKRTRHVSYVAAHNEKQARAFISAYEGKHHKWRIHRVNEDVQQRIIHEVKHRCDLTKKGAICTMFHMH